MTGPLGKRRGVNTLGIKTSAFRQNGQSPGQELGTASNTDGTGNGVGIKTSAVRHFCAIKFDAG